jgi:hypothetical protein
MALQTKFRRGELNPQSFLPEVVDRIANHPRNAHEWIGDVMKVHKGLLDSRTEWDLQDLLIDVAAVVAATDPDQARNLNDLKRTEYAVSRKSPPARQLWPTARII